METRNPVFILSRMWPDLSELESSGDSGILVELVSKVESILVDLKVGPVFFLMCAGELLGSMDVVACSAGICNVSMFCSR